jgi:CelD/BcsL family acetyltransferase involved in cellulose biosynthesis
MSATRPRPARAAATTLHLTLATTERELSDMAREWPALLADGAPGTTFRSLPWLHTWWRHFGGAASSGQLHLLCWRDGGGRLCAVLPLYRERSGIFWRARLLGSGQVGSDYLGLLCARADERVIAPLCCAALGVELSSGRLDLIELAGLDAGGALAEEISRRASAGFWITKNLRWRCPVAPVAADFDAYLAKLAGGAGQQFRRRLRWLRQRPGFAFEKLTSADDIAAAFPEFLALHRERWAQEGGGDGISTPTLEAFHRDAARALAEGHVARLYFLRADGARRAALYGFIEPHRFVFYQSGHERAWRPRSVGTVLLGLVLEDCFRDGLEFDFGHGTEPYKLVFATSERHTLRLHLRARTGLGLLLGGLDRGTAAARGVARALSPLLSRLAKGDRS